ncbi:hypothetical protein C5F53_02590 [Rhodoferax sp. TS-BS-61-7]|nr:hypothetical protein C5F53_02590 [Rhodoferax sp. TS-BS-61-7]
MRDNAPIAYVSWTKLSDKVVQRYSAAPHQLASGYWQSGAQVRTWIYLRLLAALLKFSRICEIQS